MTQERELYGPGGVSEIRRVASLDGSDITEGKPYFDLPDWFTRLGRNTFKIDSGFGEVIVKVPVVRDQVLSGFLNGDHRDVKQILPCIIQIPDWRAEYDIVLDKSTTLSIGDPIPNPDEATRKPPEWAGRYFSECLPSSLPGQIVAGIKFMSVPPIAYTEADRD